MFQFRRFPAYAYLIQRTLTGYCPAGLPHSEIRGSRDICSSPRLIAACHVLRRLLMPRHSPCALFSLTYRRRNSLHSIPAFGEDSISAPSFSSFAKNRFLATLGTGDEGSFLQRPFTEIAILMNYAGFTKKSFEIVIVTLHPFGCCSTIKLRFALLRVRASLLPYFTFITLFSFQGAELPASFEARSQDPKPWVLRSNSKCCLLYLVHRTRYDYTPRFALRIILVGPSGLEPPTLRLSVVRSSQLSYGPVWWR